MAGWLPLLLMPPYFTLCHATADLLPGSSILKTVPQTPQVSRVNGEAHSQGIYLALHSPMVDIRLPYQTPLQKRFLNCQSAVARSAAP